MTDNVADFEEMAERVRRGESTTAEPVWTKKLTRSERGTPYGNVHNVMQPLWHDPAFYGRIWLNELTQAAECESMPWDSTKGPRPWADADDVWLASWMQEADINASPGTCADAVCAIAADKRINPLQQWLSGLTWDRTERLESLFGSYFDCAAEGDDEEERAARKAYLVEAGVCTLLAAVARAFTPGCKVDHVLVLKGRQGVGKSTGIAKLCPNPDWFTDEISELGTKDSAQDLRGKWIIELAELAATRKADREKLKAFLTRSVDHYRPSYGRRSEDFPRRCIFVGTTNADEFLVDETGNRRFWPVTVRKVNLDVIERDRDQLWAEAVALFRSGKRWWLDEKTERTTAKVQADHVACDPWHEDVMRWAEGEREVTVENALGHIGIDIPKRSQRERNRIAAIFKAEKWERQQTRTSSGQRRWIYMPTTDETKETTEAEETNGWSDEL